MHALHPDLPAQDIAKELLASSTTELVVVTAGSEGATGFTESSVVHVPAPRVNVVDTVGAGDSFMAGLLAVLVDWEDHHGRSGGPAGVGRGTRTAGARCSGRRCGGDLLAPRS